MTLEDLRTMMNNTFSHWVDIETDDNGEIIIRTGLVSNTEGFLEEMV
jgi:hypothetical protein